MASQQENEQVYFVDYNIVTNFTGGDSLTGMNTFLRACRRNLEEVNNLLKVRAVLGTEACDLDSAVSTLVISYLYHHKENEAVFPVLNIKREDLPLKTEVKYLMETSSIPLHLLIFRDEINLEMLHRQGKLLLTLVDHNVLSPTDECLATSVTEIIDHHKEECGNRFPEARITIEPVGSCATLVAECVIKERIDIIDTIVAGMLLSAILLDTVCLSPAAQKTTEKDQKVVNELESFIDGFEREQIFKDLQNAKCDTSGLTGDQLLRKDLKIIQNEGVAIAIATIPVKLQDLYKTADEEVLSNFCKSFACKCLVVMSYTLDGSTISRQLAIYSPTACEKLTEKILRVLEQSDLQLSSLPNVGTGRVLSFQQGNTSASRKVLLPILRSYLDNTTNVQEIKNNCK